MLDYEEKPVLALRRRRAAAMRCPPLDDGHRDPHHDVVTGPVPPGEVSSWRAAWCHLAVLGYRVDVPAGVALAGHLVDDQAAR